MYTRLPQPYSEGHDWSTSFQWAIDCPDYPVYTFPAGEYWIAKTLVIPPRKVLRANPEGTILYAAPTLDGPVFSMVPGNMPIHTYLGSDTSAGVIPPGTVLIGTHIRSAPVGIQVNYGSHESSQEERRIRRIGLPTYHGVSHLEDTLFLMSQRDPGCMLSILVDAVMYDTCYSADLSFMAEYAGFIRDSRILLLSLENHPEALVREGVIYGLANYCSEFGDDECYAVLLRHTTPESESSEAVRDAATECLDFLVSLS